MSPDFLGARFRARGRKTITVMFAGVFMWSFFSMGLFAAEKQRLKTKRTRTPKVVRPEELRGSKSQRIEQNSKAIRLGINQIKTSKELTLLAESSALSELTSTEYYFVDRGISPARKLRRGKKIIICPARDNRVFVRAYVKAYADVLTRDFFMEFKKKRKLKITSGVRTLEEQVQMRTKGSCCYTPYAATIAESELEESLHVRGIVIDISFRVVFLENGNLKETAMPAKEKQWMRKRLISDKLKGIEFEVENQEESTKLESDPIEENICFHIVVFPK